MKLSLVSTNYNNWNHNVDAILEALQACDYQARIEREGASNKKHQLLGVGLLFVDSAEQYVVPCFNDMEFELTPIVLREGKLVVTMKAVGKAKSIGHQWFESVVTEGNGHLAMFMTSQDKVNEAVRTEPPIYEPPVVVVPKDEAAAAASTAAADAVNQTAPAGTAGAAAA